MARLKESGNLLPPNHNHRRAIVHAPDSQEGFPQSQQVCLLLVLEGGRGDQ